MRRDRRPVKESAEDGGLSFDPALVMHGDFRIESGYAAGIQLLKAKPDAMFVANYLMTVGFMRALRQYRLRCPEDIRIVTCDDHPWLDSFRPRLTTVNLPKYELGQAGARTLLERINPGEKPPPRRNRVITLKTVLCLRESCGFELNTPRTT